MIIMVSHQALPPRFHNKIATMFSRKKHLLDLLVTIVATLQEARINVYFILIS